MPLDRVFLDYSVAKLRQHAARIDTCFEKLSDERIWARGHDNENAIGNLALHLAGNVRQWIVAGVGGAPDHRDRDAEFAARGGRTRSALQTTLQDAVNDAVGVLEAVTPERLEQRITVQKYDLSVMEAIYHVVEHFALHTGQIIFATKLLTAADLGFYAHLNKPTHQEKTP